MPEDESRMDALISELNYFNSESGALNPSEDNELRKALNVKVLAKEFKENFGKFSLEGKVFETEPIWYGLADDVKKKIKNPKTIAAAPQTKEEMAHAFSQIKDGNSIAFGPKKLNLDEYGIIMDFIAEGKKLRVHIGLDARESEAMAIAKKSGYECPKEITRLRYYFSYAAEPAEMMKFLDKIGYTDFLSKTMETRKNNRNEETSLSRRYADLISTMKKIADGSLKITPMETQKERMAE